MFGILPIRGVRCIFGGLEMIELLRELVELLKPLDKKLESILTGEAGRKYFDLSPSATTGIALRVFE